MDSQQLKAFLCIAECGSFSKAEDKFFLSKQSLLRQMNALEQEVGAKLFTRNSQGITLTDAGLLFYNGAKELVTHAENIIKSSRSINESGKLTLLIEQDYITTPFTYIIQQFVKKYPYIPVEHIDISQQEYLQSILDHKLSIWFCYYQPNLDISRLKYTHLYYDKLWCIMDKDHPLAEKDFLSLKDLCKIPLYVGSSYWANRLNETFQGDLKYSVQLLPPTISAYTKKCIEGAICFADKWKCDHIPGFLSRPFQTDLKFSYGMIALQQPDKATSLFIETALANIKSLSK